MVIYVIERDGANISACGAGPTCGSYIGWYSSRPYLCDCWPLANCALNLGFP